MTKNVPSQASVGQAVVDPRRAMRATMPSADPKNRIPCASRNEVGCHSVMIRVTVLLVDRPRA